MHITQLFICVISVTIICLHSCECWMIVENYFLSDVTTLFLFGIKRPTLAVAPISSWGRDCWSWHCGWLCLLFVCVYFRKQQGGGGGHDAGVVYVGQQEERPHQETEPALSAVREVLLMPINTSVAMFSEGLTSYTIHYFTFRSKNWHSFSVGNTQCKKTSRRFNLGYDIKGINTSM